jgi:hypothetical protein
MSRVLRRAVTRAFIIVTTLIMSVGLSSMTAFAGQPVTQTLNPPAPSFYDCSAVGDGTICQGSRVFENPAAPTGITCGSGADAFEVFDEGVVHQVATRYYDRDGNLTKRVTHNLWTDAQWSNPLSGEVVPYIQMDTATDVLAIPGDFASSTLTDRGQNIYRTSDGGKPIMVSVGRTVFGPGDELIGFSGHQWAVSAFYLGDPSVLDEVCAALS